MYYLLIHHPAHLKHPLSTTTSKCMTLILLISPFEYAAGPIGHLTAVTTLDTTAATAPHTAIAAHSNYSMAGMHVNTMGSPHIDLATLANAADAASTSLCLYRPLPVEHKGVGLFLWNC